MPRWISAIDGVAGAAGKSVAAQPDAELGSGVAGTTVPPATVTGPVTVPLPEYWNVPVV